MSNIIFRCSDDQKEEIKKGMFEIIHHHYITSAFPNSNAKYNKEDKAVYAKRLEDVMNNGLCTFEDVEEGLCVKFDTTEDAGFTIAREVYQTEGGYNDEGLTYLGSFFKTVIKKYPDIPFVAECECVDSWVEEEYHVAYDGESFDTDAPWAEYEF